MKLYKLWMLASLSLAVVSCDKELNRSLDDATVCVILDDEVISEGQIVSISKGSSVEFRIEGSPDYVVFYSGEDGHRYIYRDRTELDTASIETSVLSFSVEAQYGNPAGIFSILYSHDFSGLYKDDFVTDSALVESSSWTELVPQDELPQVSYGTASFDIDLKEHFGENMTIAIRYQSTDVTMAGSSQSRINFTGMGITNTLETGSTSEISPSEFGFTALNMNYKDMTDSQLQTLPSSILNAATANRDTLQYVTVTNGARGFWNLSNIGTGSFQMNSSNTSGDARTYTWLVSDYLKVNSCDPDEGVSVKTLSTSVDTYEYTYEDVGTYTATFVLTNANYKYSDTKVCNIIVDVN